MFGSYERSLKALSEFYNLVAKATFSQISFSPHVALSPPGQKQIGPISASNQDRALMFSSYERSQKALSEFYNLVAMAILS